LTLLLFCAAVFAQQAPPPAVSPHARLVAARSIYIEHSGERLPYDVIGDAFVGWGRYQFVSDPSRADLIVSIVSAGADSGLSLGGPPRSAPPAAVIGIHLLVLDAHDHAVLWSGSEQPKSAIKSSKREDNEVDTSLRLFRRFRDSIEPVPQPSP
jgi:hypothetical protein